MEETKTEQLASLLNDWQNNGNITASEVLNRAEVLIAANKKDDFTKKIWHKYLDITRLPKFLQKLSNDEKIRWAETTFSAIRISNYNFKSFFDQRVNLHPERIFFKVADGEKISSYSYKWVDKRTRQLAALFYSLTEQPRVAIYSENTLEGACCDLACLSYDILNSPLNIHFGNDVLTEIFKKIEINIAVTDSVNRLNTLLKVKEESFPGLIIIYAGFEKLEPKGKYHLLEQALSVLDVHDAENILEKRKKLELDDTATILFTSGSTGLAKGVCFSQFNVITKRFARAAALPFVGENELLLCYLPLFHTFGRYLELMGMLFWGGTYVFAGNPSVETLLKLMQKLHPTGLISIPLRWVQIRDKFLEESHQSKDHNLFNNLVGQRLRWGLSAAGYLEPKVFSFFHNHNVELCSGFGMTEATGGISMTPPGDYIPNSVGVPLPGIKTRFTENGEMEISGPYVARYLDSETDVNSEYWLPTGDLFKVDKNGHYYIIDRVKDIYKNIKGQTIAPRRIEKVFENVPGFKRTFLVGDGMGYNTLLIVPDRDDEVLAKAESKKKIREFFQPIVASANKEFAPFERIIDFTIIDRDFSEAEGELTAKGTYRRKNIQENFKHEINRMYSYTSLEYKIDDYKIIIPRWVFRDLAITEYEIKGQNNGLYNKLTDSFLPIKMNYKTDRLQIGDFEYIINTDQVDLGILIRQPMLWTGNISLINFAYCKDGWDSEFVNISSQVFLASEYSELPQDHFFNRIHNSKLKEINKFAIAAMFGKGRTALASVKWLEKALYTETHRISSLIRRRIEALALHKEFEIRSLAYRILLFDEPKMDYSQYLPAFVNSGLPFLDKDSIEEMSKMNIERSRLEALRQRLEAYRNTIHWPAGSVTVLQFKRILELLVNFTKNNRFYYSTVREELISWILLKQEPALSQYAAELFNNLATWFESTFHHSAAARNIENWRKRITYQEGFSAEEIQRIEKILTTSTFLDEALFLIFEEEKFHLESIPEHGIWISKILSPHNVYLYRLSINTLSDKHFDIMLLVKDDIAKVAVRETMFWMIKIAGYPGRSSVLPKFGNYRSSLGALSLLFINELSAWDKIREYSCTRISNLSYRDEFRWKLLFVRALKAFFIAWKASGKQIVPGSISPSNVVVPDPDFKENSYILSLSGWEKYKNTLSLMKPIIKNFYNQTTANYPWNKEVIKIEWIFDAIMEAFDFEEAVLFLNTMKTEINSDPINVEMNISGKLEIFLNALNEAPYSRLSFLSAIQRYNEWIEANPGSTSGAKDQFIKKLYWLYHLERFPEVMRYEFYKQTYFAECCEEVKVKLHNLIEMMFIHPDEPATRLIELSELQEVLSNPDDRVVFSKIVFPEVLKPLQMELIKVGEDENRNLLVKTSIKDNKEIQHDIRKAVSPFEVGSLYRMFILDDYPVNVTTEDQFIIITDDENQESVNGGICYKVSDTNVAHLEGIIVASPLRGRGIGGALLEDFCSRMLSEGIKVITTQFLLPDFFEKYQFKVDSRWGGLVRFLSQ